MKKMAVLIATAFCAVLPAEAILDVNPADVMVPSNRWTNKKTFCPAQNQIMKEGNLSFLRMTAQKKHSEYRVAEPSSLPSDNMTCSALVRVNGRDGHFFIIARGAGSYLVPGYRLALTVKNNKVVPYFLMVAPVLEKNKYRAVTVRPEKGTVVPHGKWFHLCVTVNRAGDARMYINGELVGKASVAMFAKDRIEKNRIWMYAPVNKNIVPADRASLDVARVKILNELSSSTAIAGEAGKLLEKTK